jgi:hypothetical protein
MTASSKSKLGPKSKAFSSSFSLFFLFLFFSLAFRLVFRTQSAFESKNWVKVLEVATISTEKLRRMKEKMVAEILSAPLEDVAAKAGRDAIWRGSSSNVNSFLKDNVERMKRASTNFERSKSELDDIQTKKDLEELLSGGASEYAEDNVYGINDGEDAYGIATDDFYGQNSKEEGKNKEEEKEKEKDDEEEEEEDNEA